MAQMTTLVGAETDFAIATSMLTLTDVRYGSLAPEPSGPHGRPMSAMPPICDIQSLAHTKSHQRSSEHTRSAAKFAPAAFCRP